MNRPNWQLYGTLGCHLCDHAEQLLQQFSDTRPIQLEQIDIADLSPAQTEALAMQIPVLTTGHSRLSWPFSLADLMRAYQSELPNA